MPLASSATRWSMTNASPKFSQAISSWRVSWTRTGFADRLRHQRGVVGHGVGAVDAVAARPSREDDTDAGGRHAEQHRRRVSQRVDGLRGGPDGDLLALHVGHGAGAADRAVHLVRIQIRGLHHRGGTRERGVDVARVDEQRVARRALPQMLVERALRRQSAARRPRRLQLCRRLHRLPGLLGDDADEVAS